MAKLRVGIVFGGKSAEHEVSLQSAKNIVEAIDKTRFDVVLLGIDKQGQWHISDAQNYLLNAQDPARIALRPSTTTLAHIPGREHQQMIDLISRYKWADVALVGGDFTKLSSPFATFAAAPAAKDWLSQKAITGYSLLIKGSRSMKMEQVLSE